MKRAGLPWFRFYANTIDDLAISRLSDSLYRIWVGLQCLTSECGGTLPPPEVIAFRLRKNDRVIDEALKKLIDVGLLEAGTDGVRPRNWVELQYKSDSSTNRVRAHRERRRNVSSAVAETAPDTESETDTETDSETEGESSRARGDEAERITLPPDFKLTAPMIVYAKAKGYDQTKANDMFIAFRNHHQAKGTEYADWTAGWRVWVDRESQHTRDLPAGNFL